jgi:hypothetical protein
MVVILIIVLLKPFASRAKPIIASFPASVFARPAALAFMDLVGIAVGEASIIKFTEFIAKVENITGVAAVVAVGLSLVKPTDLSTFAIMACFPMVGVSHQSQLKEMEAWMDLIEITSVVG